MEIFPHLRIGLLNGSLLVAAFYLTFGILLLLIPRQVFTRLYTGPRREGADPSLSAAATDTTHTYLARYTLTVTTVDNGFVTKSPNQPTYLAGTVVTLSAEPATNWIFDHWTGDASGTTAITTVTMDRNKTVTAVFREFYMIYLPLVLRNSAP